MNIEEFEFIGGVGNFAQKQASIMSACVAKYRMDKGEDLGDATDQLECVCPVIRAYAIKVNDASWWEDNTERTAILRPFVGKLLDTKDTSKELPRMFLVVDHAVRVFAPMALDSAGLQAEATKLRQLPLIDSANADAAYAAATGAAYAATGAAYAAADAAYAAAYATAYAAYAAATGAAYAANAANAAAAAYAANAANAAADAAATHPARDAALKLLAKLCEV